MSNSNGEEKEKLEIVSDGKPRILKCPFLNDWCIKDKNGCAIAVELFIGIPGRRERQKVKVCSLPALVQMISEINSKTQPPQQKITLPPGLNILRG